MAEYLQGVSLVYCIPEEDSFSAAVFPFELIGSYKSVQDIPQYTFKLERQVKREIAEFRDEMEMRTIHQMYQPRVQPRRNTTHQPPTSVSRQPQPTQLPSMARAQSTPLHTLPGTVTRGTTVRPGAIVHFDGEMDESDSDDSGSRGNGSLADRVSPDTVITRLPAIRKPEEPRPTTSRLRNLFRSKTRQAPKA
ncbi:hypothetical protein GGF46_001698 [Coemansia sp. RSA 552]|nr:hypothetical protein GGF46_001698 [Coemansia sp. RSA 552]